MIELRCGTKLHGVVDDQILEVRCGSRFCGKEPGVVVLHRFNLHTGGVETRKFRDPSVVRERT